ncbi:PadR family transcriptional regulator [Patulibacter defluvii]|uniref:PadR family transcriptional regulator n=1 Tax=Patulibacter defluvii TaxID=3095358 RepID=UPI002A755616|nr:PadR family transcriptional regulator [Patulibacter sp. DM4]
MTRQDIRLTGTSYAVLGLVRHLGRATPYDLKQLLTETIENFWPVPHTTFYAEPARLAGAGYLHEDQEQGGRRRKRYELTDRGRAALEAWAAEPSTTPPQVHDEGLLKVFLGADPERAFAERRSWHEAKVAELEGYRALADEALAALADDAPERAPVVAMRNSLDAGIAFHRTYLQLFAVERERG